MTIIEALQVKTAAAECFANLADTRRKLTGVPLTSELFESVNGVERGLEHLLGRDVIVPSNVEDNVKLRAEIFAAIEAEEINCGNQIRAALECLGDDLVEVIQKYDARSSQDLEIRGKISTIAKEMSKDAVKQFVEAKCDFSCFSNADILEIIELLKDCAKFLKSDVVNKSKIQDLMVKQGQDMTDEDKEFLKDLRKIFDSTVRTEENYDKLWHMRQNRLTGTTVGALGFCNKTLAETANDFAKAETKFIEAVRVLREILADRPMSTDSVAIKNVEFDDALWGMCSWCDNMGRLRAEVNEQFSLMLGLMELCAQPKQEDNHDQEGDTNAGDTAGGEEETGSASTADNPDAGA